MTVQSEVSTNAKAPFMLGRQRGWSHREPRLRPPSAQGEQAWTGKPGVPPDRGHGSDYSDTDEAQGTQAPQCLLGLLPEERLAEAKPPNHSKRRPVRRGVPRAHRRHHTLVTGSARPAEQPGGEQGGEHPGARGLPA